MLQKKDINYIEHQKSLLKNDFKVKWDRNRDLRIRNKAKKAIQHLTYLAENLPEKQLKQMFNKENMKPFLEALFKLKPDNRDRILSLWRAILMDVANTTYVLNLVGRERWQMITRPKSTELQALFSTVLFEA